MTTRSSKAELVGRDPKTDLAVIRVKPDKPLPVVSFGDSDKLRIGEWVMAIGNPFGLGGSVSARHRFGQVPRHQLRPL